LNPIGQADAPPPAPYLACFAEPPTPISGDGDHWDHRLDDDHWEQPATFFG
jgi:catalase